jgi:hypothetical protein
MNAPTTVNSENHIDKVSLMKEPSDEAIGNNVNDEIGNGLSPIKPNVDVAIVNQITTDKALDVKPLEENDDSLVVEVVNDLNGPQLPVDADAVDTYAIDTVVNNLNGPQLPVDTDAVDTYAIDTVVNDLNGPQLPVDTDAVDTDAIDTADNKAKSLIDEKQTNPTVSVDSEVKTESNDTQLEDNTDNNVKSKGMINDKSTSTTTNVLDLPSPEIEEDEEVRLAMEMAIAAAKNPHLSPLEIQRLVGEKNAQAKMIDEFSKQNEEKIKQNQLKVKELQRSRSSVNISGSVASSWWIAAAKKAEEMKDRAERSLYAEQISKDETILEIRKTMKILKKTLKAHRLQGNRVETRHAFKRQRMEKRLLQSTDKLKKTQEIFTNSNYNVQEYLKAMMRASKKWRKVGNDDELLLEAQLSRNMHQMLALEKQKGKCKKNTKEMKKYLQRCKGWLSDKKAFCEMNIMTIDATQNSIMRLYEETLRRQDKLIAKYKASDEFQNVDLSAVDLSHVTLPNLSYTNMTSVESSPSVNGCSAMRGLPIVDSIRKKKGFLDHSYHSEKVDENEEKVNSVEANPEQVAQSRKELLEQYYKNKEIVEQYGKNTTELYVVANKDDESISSRLSDPDASFNHGDIDNVEESDDEGEYGNDAPWNSANRSRFNSTDSSNDISANH